MSATNSQARAGTRRNWPWRDGNRFQLFEDNARFFASMINAIDAARVDVMLEMYLVESGIVANRFIEALARAAHRGLGVYVVLDAFGSLGLAAEDRRRLADAGVDLRFYNAIEWRKRLGNFLRDHRKLLVVDGEVAFVGGAGLTDEFAVTGPPGWPWRDLVVEIRGPVVYDWQRAFALTWNATRGNLTFEGSPPGSAPGKGARGRVVLSEAWYRSDLANAVATRIGAARTRAWIMSAYFVPSRRFRKALRRAARRGVDVRLLVPGPLTDHPWVRHAARRFYAKLLRSGVRIFELQTRVLHGKMTICDDWVSIGSSNLDRWSFKWNLEANQEVDSPDFAHSAALVFESDCRQSLELDRRRWPRRAWLDRQRERIAGALDRWLDRWRRPRSP
ncbi:MAG TPA: phosphatidylserine/phosphatidylglycerophosphate/cardiolipin synthase family protein [Steroidobacteraceae bacterium]|nr:phosphatidylserine/phosphatidylglycerophosphate/cardiolipin synthase family protein [Steroidobacteraceae bacterium]